MENIRYSKRDADDEGIISVARKAYAYDFIKEFPDQFNTEVGENGVKLSGGQKQRIAIAWGNQLKYYNMEIQNNDILIDWKFSIVSGIK